MAATTVEQKKQVESLSNFWENWSGHMPTSNGTSQSMKTVQTRAHEYSSNYTVAEDKLDHLRKLAAFVTSNEAKTHKPACAGLSDPKLNQLDSTSSTRSTPVEVVALDQAGSAGTLTEDEMTPPSTRYVDQEAGRIEEEKFQNSEPPMHVKVRRTLSKPEPFLELSSEDLSAPCHIRILKGMSISSMYSSSGIEALDSSLTLSLALEKLSENATFFAPVVEKGRLIGILDVMQILRFVDFLVLKFGVEAEPGKAVKEFSSTKLSQLLEHGKKPGEWKPLNAKDSLWHLVSEFSKGVHVVAIVDDAGDVVDLVSQLNLIKLFAAEEALLGEVGNKQVSSLMRPRENLHTVQESTLTWFALDRLVKQNVSAVPILEGPASDKLSAELTASNLAGLTKEAFGLLLTQTVMEYLKSTSPFNMAQAPVTCEPETTLSAAISKVASSGAQRVWVTDSSTGSLLGLLSFSDLCKHVCKI